MYIKKANYSKHHPLFEISLLFLNTANVHKKSELQQKMRVPCKFERCSLILLMYIKKANYSLATERELTKLLFLNTANVHKKSELQPDTRKSS